MVTVPPGLVGSMAGSGTVMVAPGWAGSRALGSWTLTLVVPGATGTTVVAPGVTGTVVVLPGATGATTVVLGAAGATGGPAAGGEGGVVRPAEGSHRAAAQAEAAAQPAASTIPELATLVKPPGEPGRKVGTIIRRVILDR